jgi:hypothetical protein
MSASHCLVFDGKVFHPEAPVELKDDTRVRVTIEAIDPYHKSRSFLQTAHDVDQDGPADGSARPEEYLYGDSDDSAQ